MKETAPKTLKGQITATGPYRYRLEGIVRAAFHIKSIENSIKSHKVHPVNEYELLRDIPAHEENGDEVFSE